MFFEKLPYPRIRILPIPIRVSVSVLHRSRANKGNDEGAWPSLLEILGY